MTKGTFEYEEFRRSTFNRGDASLSPLRTTIQHGSSRDRDIKTGIPPKMKPEAREAWEKRREEMSIERMFR